MARSIGGNLKERALQRKSSLQAAGGRLKQRGEKVVARLRDRTIRLGVTGLSGSGKTTFITSLINQLTHIDSAKLNGFGPVLSKRLVGGRIVGTSTTFPYHDAMEALSVNPADWPQSTTDVSSVLIELRMRKNRHLLNRQGAGFKHLFLEIQDYPGEWLMDLPLLHQSFAQWSVSQKQLCEAGVRQEAMGKLSEKLNLIDPLAEADVDVIQELNSEFVHFLRRCRKELGLSYLQPGRYLVSGKEKEEFPLPVFIPLFQCEILSEKALSKASPSSYYAVCQSRYRSYQKNYVKPFLRESFQRIDRQLILVDVLGALYQGEEVFNDMRRGLSTLAHCFHYGKGGRLQRVFFPKIDKLAFIATKADQTISSDHESIRNLLGDMLQQSYQPAVYEGVELICEAVSAVCCTQEAMHEGKRIVHGQALSDNHVGYSNAHIFKQLSDISDWDIYTEQDLPHFRPPAGISEEYGPALPHIRMDIILERLIGDKCR